MKIFLFPDQIMKPSKHLNAFHKVFGKHHSFGKDFEAYNITGTSYGNGLTLYLDAHTLTGPYKNLKDKNNNFLLNLEHFNHFPLSRVLKLNLALSLSLCLSLSLSPLSLSLPSLSPYKNLKNKNNNFLPNLEHFTHFSLSGVSHICTSVALSLYRVSLCLY